ELRLGGVGILLLDALEDGLGGLVDERLGLLQTEGGQTAHLLDDGDLRGAGGLEDDVELGLLLLGRGVAAASGGGGAGGGHGGGRGDVEQLRELLHELRELDEGQLLESFDELVVAELRHGGVPSCWWDLRPCGVERRTRARSCGPVTRGRGVRGTALRLKGGSREPEAQAASCFSRKIGRAHV